MGQEQSGSRHGQADTHVTPHNVPYTSYSVEKSAAKPKREKAKMEDIMIVSEGLGNRAVLSKSEDPDMEKLDAVPQPQPLLRGPINSATFNVFDKFDPRPLLELCVRFENHQKQCAEAVSFDQDMLATRVKEMDAYCTSVLRQYTDRYKRLSHTAVKVKKVEEMNATLKRIDARFKLLVPMMNRLNNVLPEEERLEAFTLEPSYSIQ